MKNIKNMIRYNFNTLIKFVIIYKLVSSVIAIPLFLIMFKLITRISGYKYLTYENFISFLTEPITIIFLLLLIILITFYTLLDMSTLIVIIDASYQKKKISVKEAFMISLKKSMRVFKRKNILLPFLVLFLIPFLNLGISSGIISTIAIPEFISDYISNNTILSIIYGLVVIILFIIMFRWFYVVHYFVIEDCDFKEAKKRSINLSKKNKIKDFIYLIFVQLVMVIVYLLSIGIGIFLILFIYKISSKTNILGNLSISIIWLLIALSLIVFTLLTVPISYAIISYLYYEHKNKINEKVKHINVSDRIKISNNKFNIIKYVIVLLVIVSATSFTYSVLNNKYDFNIEYVRLMEVTAHRGASVKYPENTMEAFIGAKEMGADYIELDVQQTKDNELIVIHDSNLKRTTGVDKNTWEVTYEEIKDLDAGSFLNKKYKDARIPLLEEVIKFAIDNDIKLNIELKPTGREKDFEKMVVDLINKYDFSSRCVVTSQVYEVLTNIKKYDKNVQTVYVMSLAYGDITKLKDADSFSIEASSVNKTLVKKVHNSGKELYVWTVNTNSSINKMIELNVDNIITDDILLCKDMIYKSKTSNIVQEYIKFINKLG